MSKISQVKINPIGANRCSLCNHELGEKNTFNNFCSNCGAKLDWSEVDNHLKSMSPKDRAIQYCKNITTSDEDYLSSIKHNIRAFKDGLADGDEYEGCPHNYGLEPCNKLCEIEPDGNINEQCKLCWEQALLSDQ